MNMSSEVPVFIKVEEYDEILSIIKVIKKKLDESKEKLAKIKHLKSEEDKEILEWEDNLRDVHEKIVFVDEMLKEPKF